MRELGAGILVFLLWMPPAGFAVTYYVHGQQGDDSRDGTTPETAWRTLDRVNQQVFAPGDKLLFRAGTVFRGQLRPAGSGSEGGEAPQPILIDRYGDGPNPRLDGRGVMPATLYLYNVEYWEVNNLEITNFGSEREAGRCGVYVHIRDFGTAHHIYLRNLSVHDVNGSLVKKEGAGFGIRWRNEGTRVRSRFDGLLIEGCTVRRCERNGILGASAFWQRNKWYPSLHVVIRNNLIEEVPGDGIVPLGCDGALVEYNIMRDSPRLLPATEAAAGIWPWACDNTVIQFNEVSDHKAPTDAQGFDSDWNCRNTLIQYNYSHDNEGGFLLVCNNGGVGMPYSIGNVGTVVRYNVSINDGIRAVGKNAGVSPAFHISGPVEDTRIYNNTIYVARKPADNVDRMLLRTGHWGGPWPRDTRFTNNIFYVEETAGWDYGDAVDTVFECNLYWGEQENQPNDALAIREDPLFENPGLTASGVRALLGLRLREGSPAIGTGVFLEHNGGSDFLGTPLPRNRPPSLGALEAPRWSTPRGPRLRHPGHAR